ncbi:benzoate 4-monooxygenase cytochrome P450 [Aspergillus affinis]|uniref:benzoate 4-monooxygenase cytochrome P450 n=1 Tax=Aspergillus affinis TaxID=1070780 RepID=UPI0022FDD5CE|nr:benzoate 4-monooxygenase cytochrome P450 [Aspergillus affinis]KAI9039123.1 benzoate 4-monooxygenase cytochrome P450 [Aspergillus affinis]
MQIAQMDLCPWTLVIVATVRLYNIYLYPLRGYPGPAFWAASRLPWYWYQFHGTLNQRLLHLYRQYSQTIRVIPNELSFTTAAAWKAIYGSRFDEISKDPIFSLLIPTGAPNTFVSSLPAISKELILFQMLKYYNFTWLYRFFMPRPVSGACARNISRVVDTVTRRIERRINRKDFLNYILAAMQGDKGMTRDEINVNAFSFSIARSEATATALAVFVFYICIHPRIYRILVAEIRSRFEDKGQIGMSTVNYLSYFNAVFTEVFRMHLPVAITLPRVVPCAGVFIDGRFFPPGTSVGVNHFSTYRDPCNFFRPDNFVPER